MRVDLSLPILDQSQVGDARRRASAAALELGFSDADVGRVAIVVTEAASNLVKHATRGEILVRKLDWGGLEVLALDLGPGIPDVARALRGGHSTAGTPGTGLGAIARLSRHFEIDSRPGAGTAILARFWPETGSPPPRRLETGAVCLPMPGEEACGDGWEICARPQGMLVAVADGVGHGEQAAEASREAIRLFRENLERAPAEILEAVHGALRSTRGAVMAVAELDLGRRVVRYAGVGNISGAIVGPAGEHRLVSMHGTLGHDARRFKDFAYSWPEDGLLVLHTDGLSAHWSIEAPLTGRDPSLIAGVLWRDHRRERDDSTVVVVREARKA